MGQERVKGETATKVEIVLGVLFVLGALSSLGQGHLYSSQAVFSTVGMLFLGAYLLVIIAAEMLRRSRLRCCGVPRCAATR